MLLSLVSAQFASAQQRPAHRGATGAQVRAASLTGTYSNSSSEFKVKALGGNKLRVRFDGTFAYKVRGELTANMGTGEGVVTLEGNTAEFVPQDTQGCSINLKFVGRKLVVKQKGTDADCGFGHRVYASGTYTKRSNRPPNFESQ
jgi:hypothetical protein